MSKQELFEAIEENFNTLAAEETVVLQKHHNREQEKQQ